MAESESTIRFDKDQYRRLCDYAKSLGKTIDEAIDEALRDFIEASQRARESQSQ